MKRLMIAVFVLIASVAATSAQASAVALPCNACTSVQASQVARGAGPGIHHVYDFLNETLRKYEVKIERDPITGKYTRVASELPVDTRDAKYFSMLVKANRDFGDISNIVVPITIVQGDVSPSGRPLGDIGAADVLESGQTRNDLFDFILAKQNEIFARANLPPNTAENLGGLLQSLGKVFTKGELLNVTLKPTFSDGSRITLTLGDGGTVAIVPRTARDPDNNALPDANVVDFVGVFSFSSAHTRERFASVASHHGIAFVGVTASTLKLSCGWDDNTLTCMGI